MVEVRYLSVIRLIKKAFNRVKGNAAETYGGYAFIRPSVGLQQNMLQTVTFVKRYP